VTVSATEAEDKFCDQPSEKAILGSKSDYPLSQAVQTVQSYFFMFRTLSTSCQILLTLVIFLQYIELQHRSYFSFLVN